jgi:hypothetical protein
MLVGLPIAAVFDMQPIVHRLNSGLAFASGAAAALQRRLARFRLRTGFSAQWIAASFVPALAIASDVATGLRTHVNRFRPRVGLGAIRNRRALPPVKLARLAPMLAPAREWEMIANLLKRDLARIPAIVSIQAHAALKIDAAEHALNRIVADCSKVLSAPLVPVRRPARRLAHRSEFRVRRPLAA